MGFPSNFVRSLERVDPREMIEMLKCKTWPKGGVQIEFVNEIRPADLFCYLGARFGQPNGFQNALRKDDSDNLIHWEWLLRFPNGLLSILGMNFRTELQFFGEVSWTADDREELIDQFKADFSLQGKDMGKVRKHLEDWVEFVNPYQRIRRAIDLLSEELAELNLRPEVERLDDVWGGSREDVKERWTDVGARYSKGFGLCFGIRSLLPVLAESYVNLLLFVLMRKHLRDDPRLRDNVIRQPIDVRIKSLAVNCEGFAKHPDYSIEECKRFHGLVNERNDLLHGNVVVEKLKFNEVYFHGKVPIFKQYRTMWERSLEIEMNAVGLADLEEEISIVDALLDYLKSCLASDVAESITMISDRYELAINKETQRVGILFPPWLVDMRLAPEMGDSFEPRDGSAA